MVALATLLCHVETCNISVLVLDLPEDIADCSGQVKGPAIWIAMV